jgi:sulfide dehydrogenase [flavocytochrome c] flavoprotein chain
MRQHVSRRDFNKLLLSGLAGSALGPLVPFQRASASAKRVVIIGGGFGGAAAAKYLRKLDPSIAVTLIEPKAVYYTCPFSNWVIGGLRRMEDIAHTYTVLRNRYQVTIIGDVAVALDPLRSTVRLKSGKVLNYDRLIVSPGIDFKWDAIEGYSQSVAESRMPHVFQGGAQTVLLRKQLVSMKDGGTVLVCPPGGQFRCPAAPYERASLIAYYLKQHKPKSKIIILDDKEKFSKQELFMQGWDRRYPGMIEWRSAAAGGKVSAVHAASMTVSTEFGDEKGAVINVIPPQKAGKIAFDGGLTDASGWCPVNPVTFESAIHPGVHVIGDSTVAGAMPKSGFAASSQGKVAAAAIVNLFQGRVPSSPTLVSTCYSLIGPGYAISVAGVYRLSVDGIVEIKGAGGLTPLDADNDHLKEEAAYADGWYENISRDNWG